MAEPEAIVAALVSIAAHARELAERKIVVSAGPTHEPIDPVRFIGNRSSGRMGVEIAAEAASRGAEVMLVLGPGTVEPPPGVTTIHVETAREMRDAMIAASDDADAVVMAAAVADFRPAEVAPSKIKRASGPPDIHLEPTPDVLREVKALSKAVLVGFAAETGELEREGRRKLEDKDLDLIVVNEVGREGTGFASETNDALLLSRTGDDEPLRTWTKRELAATICDRIAALLK